MVWMSLVEGPACADLLYVQVTQTRVQDCRHLLAALLQHVGGVSAILSWSMTALSEVNSTLSQTVASSSSDNAIG